MTVIEPNGAHIPAHAPPSRSRSVARERDAGDPGCLTCGDRATRMQVIAVQASEGLALCLGEDGRDRTVQTGLIGEVAPGETLLVHAGTALARETGGSS